MKFQMRDMPELETEPIATLWLEQVDDNEVRLRISGPDGIPFTLMRFQSDGTFRRISSLPDECGLRINHRDTIQENIEI